MAGTVAAGLWGLLAGSSLLVGAAIGYLTRIPVRLVALVMAFGAGVLISALAFDLMQEAYNHGGLLASALGFLFGAALFSMGSYLLARSGGKHRKRSRRQPREKEVAGSGRAIALGALLDGIPESLAIGITVVTGGGVSLVAVAAVFLSNIPEAISSSAGMKHAHRSRRYVFAVWGGIAVTSGIAAALGALFLGQAPQEVVAAVIATAAGAILAMLADTMMPEAYEEAHGWTALATVAGFLAAFVLSRSLG